MTELDGLASNVTPLGDAAKAALDVVSTKVRTHGSSLKVQTSKGNYLSTLAIRSEQVKFANADTSWERNMDDLILRVALWQLDHWSDRSTLLGVDSSRNDLTGASRVVLLTFDRNCEPQVHRVLVSR